MSYQHEQHEECKQRLVQVLIEKKDLEEKVKKLTDLCERLLDHIAHDLIAASDLDEEIRQYWGRV
jgi:hypothetical protein